MTEDKFTDTLNRLLASMAFGPDANVRAMAVRKVPDPLHLDAPRHDTRGDSDGDDGA